MPNVGALMTEYAPKALRNTLVTIMYSGYAVGGVLAAGIGMVMIPNLGWESVFIVGALPLLALPLIYKYMPESIGFLIVKNQHEKVGQILMKLNPSYTPQKGDQYEMELPNKSGIPLVKLSRRNVP